MCVASPCELLASNTAKHTTGNCVHAEPRQRQQNSGFVYSMVDQLQHRRGAICIAQLDFTVVICIAQLDFTAVMNNMATVMMSNMNPFYKTSEIL